MPSREAYCETFRKAERRYEREVASHGLPFEKSESQCRGLRAEGPWTCENAFSSLRRGWISPACVACRKGVRTATFFVSLRCSRSCYFCFNPNQEDYERHLVEERDICGELQEAYDRGAQYDCLAVTGGEPFLHAEMVLEFVQLAKRLYPHAHVRIYTCGDGLDGKMISRLGELGLDELRFSVKLDDSEEERERVHSLIGMAVSVVPDVVVEMPVIPGILEDMKGLLLRLDAQGVRGINLLEFCFPLRNAREFSRRGFALRRKPFKVVYDWWYAGGFPVAGSEAEALELLRFAEERALSMGVHYCSSDNKNSGQLYRQNAPFLHDAALREANPHLAFDSQDYLLKCVKAFGKDAEELAAALGCGKAEGVRASFDRAKRLLAFHPSLLASALQVRPDAEFAVSANVLERNGGATLVREVLCEELPL